MNDNGKRVVTIFTGNVNEKTLTEAGKSAHMTDRASREQLALSLEPNPKIDKMFLVDRHHKDGQEVHVVTKGGMIYVFNNMKLFLGQKALITILIARPNQIRKLYKDCGLKQQPDDSIIEKCLSHQKAGYNMK
jgi:hypothetical protein